jgi:hypothetical protein
MKWTDCISLVLHNLHLQHGKRFFDLEKEIVPFIKNNCHQIKLNEDINKLSKEELYEKGLSILTNHPTKFVTGKEVKRKTNTWSLRPSASGHYIFAPPGAITATNCMSSPEMISPPPPQVAKKSASGARVPKNSLLSTPKKPQPDKLRTSARAPPLGRSNSVTSLVSSSTSSSLASSSKSSTSSKAKSSASTLSTVTKSITKAIVKKKPPRKRKGSKELTFPSLAHVIPFPVNFEGKNNPFYDLNEPVTAKKARKHVLPPLELGIIQEEFIVKSNADSPSKLTIQRKVSLSPLYAKDGDKTRSLLNSSNASKEDYEGNVAFTPPSADSASEYKVLARRVAIDGKVEYLLEWDNLSATGS